MDLNSTFLSSSAILAEELISKKDLDELHQKIDKFQENVLKEQEITQKLLKRVLEEVKANGNSKSSTRKPIMPKTPFKEENDFKDFEAKIEKSENKFNDLVADFLSIICGNSSKFLKEAWRKIMTDEVAQKLCWQGTNNKTPVRALSVTTALKQAYNQKFATAASDSEFERTVISFFQHANNRLQKKHAYKERKENKK
ncbi:uncharacterized protein LOC118756701 [Rhagoletis pomonella]|nr:uncharacterized protein LOC118756701 [Rhagoletis pomonella]